MKRIALAAVLTVATCGAPALAHNRVDVSVRALVDFMALIHHIPAPLAHGVVKVESRYRCNARNPRSSATGLMQVVKGTAREVGVPHESLTDCRAGLEAGMRYLRKAFARARGDWCRAASLYERGVYARPRCSAYGRRVIREARAS